MKLVNVRRYEEYDDINFDHIKKIIIKEKWNENECIIIYDEDTMKLKYFFFENEWKPIKYSDDKFDYDNLNEGTHRILYHSLQQYIDIDELISDYCYRKDLEKVKKHIKNYRDELSLEVNCELYGREHKKNIIFEDSILRHKKKYGEKEPLHNKFWDNISFSNYIIPGEIKGMISEKAYDIETLLNFFSNELRKGHYPYLDNYNYDLVSINTLKKLLDRAKLLHLRYPVLEDLIKKLEMAGIDVIDSNPYFKNELYPILYG